MSHEQDGDGLSHVVEAGQVAALVAALQQVVASDFPDLSFVDPGSELEVAAEVASVTRVRLELPGRATINLAALVVDVEGLTAADLPGCTTQRVSSVGGRFRQTPRDESALLDPGNREVAVHTAEQDRPWVELAFDRPVALRGLLVRNRPGKWSIRSRGIQVLVETADGHWRTVYDGVSRERQLVAALETAARGHGDAYGALPAIGRLTRIVTAIVLRDYGPCPRELRDAGLAPAAEQAFKKAVSTDILAPRELEWTEHGIFRSFRFWPRKEQERYVAFAMEVVEELRRLNENVCLGFGSVLAVVRDQALIPHDDDMDLLVGFEPEQASTLAQGRELVRAHLAAAGYSVTGDMMAHLKVARRGAPHKVDVFIGLFEGDAIAWYPGKRGSLTREMMFPAGSRELLGIPCVVPRRPEAYLEQVYGPGWTVPDPGFRHRWDQRPTYADIEG